MPSLAINPYYAARTKRFAPPRQESPVQAVYAKLPRRPSTPARCRDSPASITTPRPATTVIVDTPAIAAATSSKTCCAISAAFVLRPNDWQWHLPRRVQEMVSTAGRATCIRARTPAMLRSSREDASISAGYILPTGGRNCTPRMRVACRGRRPWRRSLNAIGC